MRKFINSSLLVISIALQALSQDSQSGSYGQTYMIYDNILVPKSLKSKKVIRSYKIGNDNVSCPTIKVKRKDYACPTVSSNNHEGLGVFEWVAHFGGALRKPEPCIQYTERFRITIIAPDTLSAFSDLITDTAANYQYLTLGEHFFVQQNNKPRTEAVPVDVYIKRDEGTITFYCRLQSKQWILIKGLIRDPERTDLRILADFLSGSEGDVLLKFNSNECIKLVPKHSSYYKIF